MQKKPEAKLTELSVRPGGKPYAIRNFGLASPHKNQPPTTKNMNPIDKNTLYQWFANGKKPTQDHFQGLINSFYHQKEAIPIEKIAGLGDTFAQMAPLSALQGHLQDPKAHGIDTLAKKTGDNLSPENILQWKRNLGIPNAILTYDEPAANAEDSPRPGTGYTKMQVEYALDKKLDKTDADTALAKKLDKVDAAIAYQPKGNYALADASYTKADTNSALAKKLDKTEAASTYQPKGNYAPTGEAYTKAETDVKLAATKNLANTDLSNSSKRNFTQGADFKWDTAGKGYTLANLNDVSANSAYKITTLIDENGQMGKGDLRQLLVGSFQNLSASQKTDISALLNVASTPNNHLISGVDNLMLEPNSSKTLLIYGTNLSLIPSSVISLKNAAGTSINASSWEMVNAQTIKAVFAIPSTAVVGDKYEITIYQGLVKNAGKVELMVANAGTYLTPTTWTYKTYNNTAPQTSIATDSNFNLKTEANLKALANENIEIQSWFTEKLLLGDKNWQVNIQASFINTTDSNCIDYIGVSSADDNLQNMVQFGMQSRRIDYWGFGPAGAFLALGRTDKPPLSPTCTVYLSKIANTVYTKIVSDKGVLISSSSQSIDVSKNYRIWLTKGNTANATNIQGSIQIIQY